MGTIVELLKGSEEIKELWQWDTGRQVKILPEENTTVDEVHFSNVFFEEALVVEPKVSEETGDIVADVPNILLQDVVPIEIYVVMRLPNGECTTHREIVEINYRKKPSDYIYTETEIRNYEALEARIKALEENGVGGGNGAPGADGFSPSAKVEETAEGAVITITDKSGTTEAIVKHGKDGLQGADGKTAYQYAQDGGYTGTEEEFAQKLAEEIPTKTSELENDSGFVTEGTVEITDGEPTKASTVMTLNPNAEEVNLYTAPEIDEMLQNLPSGGSGGSEYPKKVFEYEWKDNYDKINIIAIDYETGTLTVDTMPTQITNDVSTTVRVFPMLLIEGIATPFKYGFIPKEILTVGEFYYYAVKVSDNQIQLYNGTTSITALTDSGIIDLTRWKLQVEKSRNKAVAAAVVTNLERNHRYKAVFYLPHAAHSTSGIMLYKQDGTKFGAAYNCGYASKGMDAHGANSLGLVDFNVYETLSLRNISNVMKGEQRFFPKFYEIDIRKIGGIQKAECVINYFYEKATKDNNALFDMYKVTSSLYLQEYCKAISFSPVNSNVILDGSRCEVWDYGEVF